MTVEKVDRRIQRTQQLLGEALVALSAEKGYDNVTIRDITERANVAYITFFRNYKDKHELLLQQLEQVVAELESIAHRAAPEYIDMAAYHETEGLQIFRHVEQYPNFYHLLAYGSARRHIQQALSALIQMHFEDHQTTIPNDIAANHCAVSLIGLIEWWLDHKMPYPPEHMAQIYYRIIVKPILVG
jgi:AcrR family transcriptional regulator